MRWLLAPVVLVASMLTGCGDTEPQSGLGNLPRIADTRHAERVDCTDERLRHAFVLLVLGQSNAGNHGQVDGRRRHVPVFADGQCWLASDPLPGATGTGASVWTRLVPALSEALGGRPVVVAVLAVDATTSFDWAAEGELARLLDQRLFELDRAGLRIQSVLWQQGEADARYGTSMDAYVHNLQRVFARVRKRLPDAPIFVARSTRCRSEPNPRVRDAQADVVRTMPHLQFGPDLDLLGADLRHDGCHFSSAGLEAASLQWQRVLEHLLREVESES